MEYWSFYQNDVEQAYDTVHNKYFIVLWEAQLLQTH